MAVLNPVFVAAVTKMPGLPNGFKMVSTHNVRKIGCGNCGVSGPVLSYIFLSDLSHQNYLSPKIFISPGVILGHFSVSGETFHFCAF